MLTNRYHYHSMLESSNLHSPSNSLLLLQIISLFSETIRCTFTISFISFMNFTNANSNFISLSFSLCTIFRLPSCDLVFYLCLIAVPQEGKTAELYVFINGDYITGEKIIKSSGNGLNKKRWIHLIFSCILFAFVVLYLHSVMNSSTGFSLVESGELLCIQKKYSQRPHSVPST